MRCLRESWKKKLAAATVNGCGALQASQSLRLLTILESVRNVRVPVANA
jgi:hypothetical protein